jgi:uncharacterized membrane protein YecN with MAPEG domain
MPVFFVCAGLIGLLAALLSMRVGRVRTAKKISLGDGGDPEMIAAIRAHANLIEYAPLCLLLVYLAADFHGFWLTAILSVVFLLARVFHAGGMTGLVPNGRFIGTAGTIAVLVVTSVSLIISGLHLRQY